MILSWPIYGIKATGGQISVSIKWRLVVNKYYTMYITNTVPRLYLSVTAFRIHGPYRYTVLFTYTIPR